jgi:predicted secreted hydrolase
LAAVAFLAATLTLAVLPGGGAAAQTPPAAGPDWLAAAAALAPEGFERPAGPWTLALPEDHAPHPEARSEAWQLAAHLTGPDGTPIGVQLLLLRIGLVAPDAPPSASPWTPRDLYRGHVVVVDGTGAAARAEERFARGMAGLVGHDPALRELRLDDWTLVFGSTGPGRDWLLNAGAEGTRVALTVAAPTGPLTPEGDAAPFRGYAFPRLDVTGTIETAAGPLPVSGTAWFEHLWGELPLPGGTPVVSDRLLLHLDDGTAVSAIRSRRRDGQGLATVDAVVIGADGTATPVSADTAQVEIAGRWQGTGGNWPVGWTVRVDGLDLAVTPVLDDQEHAFMAPLWSGLVRAEGQRGDRPVRGWGTLQMTEHEAP